jgi:hypothetical protein
MGQARQSLVSVFALPLLFTACSGSQTGDDAIKRKKKGENQTVEDGVPTSLQISEGSLAGTAVDVPPGALPSGANVNLRSTKAPETFASVNGVSSASDAVSITAQDAGGNELSELVSPMTIQLPVSATALALSIEKKESNLCTFLETAGGELYVWRRSALALSSGKVVFESKRLGVFQVVYCGSTELSGFTEAAESDVAGSASQALAEIIIPAGEFSVDVDQYCVGVISGVEDDDKEGNATVWGFSQIAATPTAGQTLEIKRSPGKDLSNLADNERTFLFVFFQASGDVCDFESKEIERPDGHLLLAWRKLGAAYKSGTLSATIGDTLSYKKVSLSIASGANYATPTDKDVCIEVETGSTDGGVSEIITKFEANGTIGGESSYPVYYVPGTGEASFNVYLGTKNCEASNESSGTSMVTSPEAQVLRASFRNFTSAASLQLAPVKVNIAGLPSIPGVPISFPNACVSILDPADAVDSSDNDAHLKKALLSMVVSAGASAVYESYLPLLTNSSGTTPVYDYLYKGLSDTNSNCSSSGKNPTKTPNKPLTNPISVTPV